MGNNPNTGAPKHPTHSHNHSCDQNECGISISTELVPTENLQDAISKTRSGAGTNLPVSLLEPNGKLLRLLPPTSFNPRFISMLSEVFSPESPGFIYVVAQTDSYHPSQTPQQFLMMLHGLAHIGHRIVIHNAVASELQLVAADADVVIVDNASKAQLPANFKETVLKVAPEADFFVSEANSVNLEEWN